MKFKHDAIYRPRFLLISGLVETWFRTFVFSFRSGPFIDEVIMLLKIIPVLVLSLVSHPRCVSSKFLFSGWTSDQFCPSYASHSEQKNCETFHYSLFENPPKTICLISNVSTNDFSSQISKLISKVFKKSITAIRSSKVCRLCGLSTDLGRITSMKFFGFGSLSLPRWEEAI